MSEEIILNFILKELEYNRTLLNCINLGWSKSEDNAMKNELYTHSESYIKKLMKERKIKKWN